MRLSRHLHHAVQHREHPRGHTRDVGNVLVHRLTGYALTLHLKVAQQGSLLLRNTHQIDQRIDVLYQNGTEVTHQRTFYIIVGSMTTSEYQSLAIKHSRLRIIAQIDSHRVATTSIMNLLETFVADRDKLRLVVSSTTRLGIPSHSSWPQHIALTMTHAVYLTFQLFIGIHGVVLHKVFITLYVSEGMISAVFCIFCGMNKIIQHCTLQRLSPILMLLQSLLTRNKYLSYYLS